MKALLLFLGSIVCSCSLALADTQGLLSNRWIRCARDTTVSFGSSHNIPVYHQNIESLSISLHLLDLKDVMSKARAEIWSSGNADGPFLLEKAFFRSATEEAVLSQASVERKWIHRVNQVTKDRIGLDKILLPSLTPGLYAVKMKAREDVNTTCLVVVNGAALITRRMREGKYYFYVVDSNTGRPLAGAQLRLIGFRRKFIDGVGQVSSKELLRVTNRLGEAFVDVNSASGDYRWLIEVNKGQRYHSLYSSPVLNDNSNSLSGTVEKVFLLNKEVTFRPGEIVPFSGIIAELGNNLRVFRNFDFPYLISISDPSGREIIRQEIFIDDYGSFRSSYRLPSNSASGRYSIEVYHPQKRFKLRGSTYFDVRSDDQPPPSLFEVSDQLNRQNSPGIDAVSSLSRNIEINFDKEEYALGDSITLRLRSVDYRGRALLVITDGQELLDRPRVISVSDTNTRQRLDLKETFVTRSFVEVWFIQNSKLVVARRAIPLRVPDKKLDLYAESSPLRPSPGADLLLKVKVTNTDNESARARMIVALYDKNSSIESSLSKSRDMSTFFWGGIRRSKTLVTPPGHLLAKKEDLTGAYWNAELETDERGFVRVAIPLPEYATTWGISAWAVSPQLEVGQYHGEVEVARQFKTSVMVPENLIVGDRSDIALSIENFTNEPIRLQAVLQQGSPLLSLNDLTSKRKNTRVGAAQKKEFRWRYTAVAPGEATIVGSAETSSIIDKDTQVITIHKDIEPHKEHRGLVLASPRDSGQMTFPPPSYDEKAIVEITTTAGIRATLVEFMPIIAKEFLQRMNPSNVEVLSRILPIIEVKTALQRSGLTLLEIEGLWKQFYQRLESSYLEYIPGLERAKVVDLFQSSFLDEKLAVAQQFLKRSQHKDGGWGWYSADGEESTAEVTAEILYDLSFLERDEMVASAEDYLTRHLEGLMSRGFINWNDSHAYMAMVLSRQNQLDPALLHSLDNARDNLTHGGKALLGLAFFQQGERERAQNIADYLSSYAMNDRLRDITSLPVFPYRVKERVYSSHLTTNAYYLTLLTNLTVSANKVRGVANYVLLKRNDPSFVRYALPALHALTEYITVYDEEFTPIEVEISVDGKRLLEYELTRESELATRKRIETRILNKDSLCRIELQKRGDIPLYVSAVVYYPYASPKIDSAEDIVLSRRYEAYRQTADLLSDTGSVSRGDIVEVVFELEVPSEEEYLIIKDFLPAGFTTKDVSQPQSTYGVYRKLETEPFFALRSILPGKHTFSYRMRALFSGRFKAKAAQILRHRRVLTQTNEEYLVVK